MQIIASSPEEMQTAMQADSRKWGEVIAATGTTINQMTFDIQMLMAAPLPAIGLLQ